VSGLEFQDISLYYNVTHYSSDIHHIQLPLQTWKISGTYKFFSCVIAWGLVVSVSYFVWCIYSLFQVSSQVVLRFICNAIIPGDRS
jgi:hypothetical protein